MIGVGDNLVYLIHNDDDGKPAYQVYVDDGSSPRTFDLDFGRDVQAGSISSFRGTGGSLVSLRGMPNGEFATRTGMSMIKRLLLKVAGRKYDQMAARRSQKYYFVFVHEDGAALERISEIFGQNHLEASVDGVFSLDDVNEALKKVASGGSKGKTILKVSE